MHSNQVHSIFFVKAGDDVTGIIGKEEMAKNTRSRDHACLVPFWIQAVTIAIISKWLLKMQQRS